MNVVEVIIRTKDDEARAGLKATEEEAKASGERSGKGFSERFKGAMGNLGKGGLGFAGLSSALSMAAPLGAAGVAVGAFAAVAVPEMDKVQQAMSKTGKAGQQAWKQLTPSEQGLGTAMKSVSSAFHQVQASLAPVLASVAKMASRLLIDLMPALRIMATAGGKVIEGFLKPFDALVRSNTFEKFIKVMAQGAQQIAPLLGGVLTGLVKLLMTLFIQLMPAGVQILGVLLPTIVQLLISMTPVVTVVAQLIANFVAFLAKTHLLIPLLGVLAAAFLVLSAESGILAVTLAITVLVAAIEWMSKHWKQVWDGIKHVVDDAINFIQAHWRGIIEILMGPVGIAIVWITGHFHSIVGVVSSVVGSVGRAFSSVYHAIVDPVWNAVQTVFGYFNQILNFAASIPSRIGHFLGNLGSSALHMIGFEHGGIVGAATGGARSGMVMVGEHGRELVSLPGGSKVHSNPDTERMMSGGGSGGQVTISFDFGGSGSDELIKLLRGAIRVKGGNVQTVLGH